MTSMSELGRLIRDQTQHCKQRYAEDGQVEGAKVISGMRAEFVCLRDEHRLWGGGLSHYSEHMAFWNGPPRTRKEKKYDENDRGRRGNEVADKRDRS